MTDDVARHDLEELLAVVQEQMQGLAAMEGQRRALIAVGKAADGAVEVTVDAERAVTSTVIEDTYLEQFEFSELGGHVTEAARAAVAEMERRSQSLLAPLAQRRQDIRALSTSLDELPNFDTLFDGLRGLAAPAPPTQSDRRHGQAADVPTVRST